MTTPPPTDADLDGPDLRARLAVLRRHRGLIAASALVVVLVAVTLSLLRDDVYRASTEVLLRDRPSESVLNGDQVQNPLYLQQLVQTEIEVMESRSVTEAVAAELGRDPEVSIAAKGQTQVVVISAESTDREAAVEEADTYARVYIDTRRQATLDDLEEAIAGLQEQLGGLEGTVALARADAERLRSEVALRPDDPALASQLAAAEAELATAQASLAARRVSLDEQIDQLQTTATLTRGRGAQIVSAAKLPSQPVAPNPKRDAALALVLGLLLGVGLAFLRDLLDDSIRSKEALDRVSGGVPVLGMVPVLEGWRPGDGPRLASIEKPGSVVAESYRSLRTSLQYVGLEKELSLLQITSSNESEGKTTTTTNLAVALARAGRRVLIVDCDLRRPRVHDFFALDNRVGFTSVLLGATTADRAVRSIDAVDNLFVLSSGPPPPNPSELLASRRTREALRALAGTFDHVIVDSPPLLPVSDSVVLAGVVDATVVVATSGTTTGRSLGRALELLRQVDAPIIGVVLNRASMESVAGYGYGYGYGQERRRSPLAKLLGLRDRSRGSSGGSPSPSPSSPPSSPPSSASEAPEEVVVEASTASPSVEVG